MGEGWSDTVAFWSEQNCTTETPFALGSWVINDPKGIRSVLYSTDMSIDPYTYGTVATKNEGEPYVPRVLPLRLHMCAY